MLKWINNLLSFCLVLLILQSCNKPIHAQHNEDDTEAMAKYLAQVNRFEIRECRLYYNEQLVVLDSIETFERIFDSTYIKTDYWQRFYLEKPVLVFLTACKEGENSFRPCIERMSILLSHQEKYDLKYSIDSIRSVMPTLDGYILFNGVLVNADTKVEELNAKLKAKSKPTLKSSFGNKASQSIVYAASACSPAPNCQGDCLIHITLYYHDEYGTKEKGKIQTLRYEYTQY